MVYGLRFKVADECCIARGSQLIAPSFLLSEQRSSYGDHRFRRGGSLVRHTNVEL